MTGKLGRLPRDRTKPALTLEDYVTGAVGGTLPPAAAAIDRGMLVTDWPMYCNGPDPANADVCPGSPDGCGDCTFADIGHELEAWTTYAGKPTLTLSPHSIITGYSAVSGYDPQTGADDNGCQIQDVLAYMKSTGLKAPDGSMQKIAGYAVFGNPTNETLLGQVLNTFGSVYLGINVQQAQMDQFDAGQPWEWASESPILGGHAIPLQIRRASGVGIWDGITWGQRQKITRNFIFNGVEEAWVVVSNDFIEANGLTVEGLDLAQLLGDMPDVS